MLKQSRDELAKQLCQHLAILFSFGKSASYLLKDLHTRIIEKITVKNQQPLPIKDHLFLNRQHATDITFPEQLKIYSQN
ncbi:hypothetical protein AVI53_02880 [Piscirickettsia salmonis]|nr:hypothetical protein PSLF89_06160 [Piscirickettsia salmonis LF-89 = ATCC VR-1361]ALY02893.1 hypothetical protein AWE47_08610 [Piscirickettsia salmonis]AMA42448.1 hypothetical protein AWJ11_08825 [Piscirickettsia salmonis]AOS34918.1 hypothetical protein AVM72_05965 [Piscirickettsia salmonis]APS59626.1 hypothetical protein AVI53_02880 [Piscirickettsia salmonis]